MKKVNFIVSTALFANLLNCCNILTAQAQSYSSALLPDSSLAANESLNSPAGSAASGSTPANSTATESAPASAPASAPSSTDSSPSGASGSAVNGDGATKLSPAAMSPSPSFPFSFGPDGKATLNALPGPMNKAAASTFVRLLKEHLLTPSGLLSLAMNRSPGSTPSDFLMKSGKFDGLLMILSFIGSKVELSDSQIEQLQKIRNKLLDKSAPINADLTVLERKFRDQLIAPELDDKAMRSLRRQIGRDKDKLDALMTEHMIATSHVFTTEQRQKVRDLFMRMQAGPMGIKRPQEKKTTGD
ncbi:MAG: Periplasmic heavy metal sensor [Cyanobacteriota bacterium erpe_2018_sw_39hr_WHONDRS-SW48-000098_B_bin.30]|nr:Periplasmic heavy metal sensor [Cyanobacteriota bacterium erpe_2018_sw_39hr_WHONDRS-SW48-000098_B_bin.30]